MPAAAAPVPTDQPWITFPPFPKPPAGTSIVSFQNFKPSGIQIVVDVDDGDATEELDGLGIPTVQLRIRHSLTEAEQKKEKKTNRAKHTVFENGQRRRLTWWEEWVEDERYRGTSANS